jgi:acyl CoA:acetate/3-ketoacid CoA transferase
VEEALAMIPNGATIMVGGFMAVGASERLVDELVRQNKSRHHQRARRVKSMPKVISPTG